MHRFCAQLLVMVFNLPLMTPLLAAEAGAEASLPACCRKDGKHACGMSKSEKAALALPGKVTLAAKTSTCPHYPNSKSVAASSAMSDIPACTMIRQAQRQMLMDAEQKEALLQLSFARAAQKRGPPAILAA